MVADILQVALEESWSDQRRDRALADRIAKSLVLLKVPTVKTISKQRAAPTDQSAFCLTGCSAMPAHHLINPLVWFGDVTAGIQKVVVVVREHATRSYPCRLNWTGWRSVLRR